MLRRFGRGSVPVAARAAVDRAPTGAVGKILLSAEFIVKRMTRPFGTSGFTVNAGSAT